MADQPIDYLTETDFFNFSAPEVQELLQKLPTGLSKQEQAVWLYKYVRDGWRYNPYNIRFAPEHYKASAIAQKPEAHCIDKSILLVTLLRAVGIPARLHLAKVRNHIGVERLVQVLGTDEITPHGMVDVQLEGQWLKVSPAFNSGLCEKMGVAPLNFNGTSDSLFQAFDKHGNTFMEYLEDYGHFENVPLAFIRDNFTAHYPKFTEQLKQQEIER
jgi:transglutaminase-like putative cysteine protease